MKRFLVSAIACAVTVSAAYAGNDQKSGTAGASELLINPWARSSGMASSHTAGIRGVESIRLNVGGLSRVDRTEVVFANTQWLRGSDININSLGMAQPIGDNGGVLGFEIMSMNLGEFYLTSENAPDGNGTFDVRFINIGLSYSKAFSKSIFGGITVRMISESIPNARATGVCFDAGIQYVTHIGNVPDSTEGNLRFGVSLRNVGPEMRYSGDGLSRRVQVLSGSFEQTGALQAESFEIPSMLNIGAAYDLRPVDGHRVTFAGNFNSNSFTHDQFQGGIEYAFMEKFMVRGGLDYQKNIFDKDTRRVAHNGPTAGATVQVPFGSEKKRSFGVDYAYRSTQSWNGTHSIGVRLSL